MMQFLWASATPADVALIVIPWVVALIILIGAYAKTKRWDRSWKERWEHRHAASLEALRLVSKRGHYWAAPTNSPQHASAVAVLVEERPQLREVALDTPLFGASLLFRKGGFIPVGAAIGGPSWGGSVTASHPDWPGKE